MDQKANPAYPGFYNGGVHVVGAWHSPGRGPGDFVPQKLKQNVKLVSNFQRFLVENLGFNEYRCKAWIVLYFANTIQKNFEDSMGGV